MSIFESIEQQRLKYGFTGQDIARAAGLHPSLYSKLKHGRVKLTDETAGKLLEGIMIVRLQRVAAQQSLEERAAALDAVAP